MLLGAKDTEMAHEPGAEIWRVFWEACAKYQRLYTEAIAYRKAQNPEPNDENRRYRNVTG